MGIWLKKLDICLVRTNHCEGCAMGKRCTSYRATVDPCLKVQLADLITMPHSLMILQDIPLCIFESFLKNNGIVHQLTMPYNPAQNGVAERMNRTVMELARAMMSHSNFPNQFWAEAANTWQQMSCKCSGRCYSI